MALERILDWLPVGAGSLPTPPDSTRPIVLASRASKLAQIQTNMVLDALRQANPGLAFETMFMSTEGDKNQTQALYLLGGKALWTKELEVALVQGEVDVLVHCLKDMPTSLPEGCELGAILEREDPVDCLVVKNGLAYRTLDDLPAGSIVGTSSVRRVAQLRRNYPQLAFQDVVCAPPCFAILKSSSSSLSEVICESKIHGACEKLKAIAETLGSRS
jgi:hydroxymethylbilane synthase